ncbi:hypothetical protein POTOM_025062 [Populus tomentosa]|uniref:HMA domain-containing protein n=1 Tax=Populus tomentosa TaxID=118781 RepID=A0A8X7ZKI8_POPTO|nr:hypothetical protein POTOM_025062 [Populus tomentosa]
MWRLKIAAGGNPWLGTNNDHIGRQIWEFDPKLTLSPEEISEIENARQNFTKNRFQCKHSADLIMRMQFEKENPVSEVLPQVKLKESEKVTEEAVTTTLKRGLDYYSSIQAHDGHWPGDYGGPLFLMPGLNRDGGWGLHIEGPSTMFGSVLNYVTLRLLGEGPNDGEGAMEKGRDWILNHGGATMITSWGKMWLSVLGVFEWSGNNPMPPEMWLLPYLLPVHPVEIETIVFPLCRKDVVSLPDGLSAYVLLIWEEEDLYYPHPLVQDVLWALLDKAAEPVLMHWPGKKLREKALCTAMEHIHYEDENTRYLCIGPVNKGYNGSQLWDTAFAVQAIISTNLVEEYSPTLKKAHAFVKNSQNGDGGFATYELTRSYSWLELINPAETFGDIVIDYPYVECTSAAIQALTSFKKLYPGHRSEEIDSCIKKATMFIESIQEKDGSWLFASFIAWDIYYEERAINQNFQKKTVLKVNINCMKCKKELVKTVGKIEGIDQIAINSEKGTMIVVGIVDPVVLVNKLRKAGKVAEFISVGPYKKEDVETEKPKNHHNFPSCCKQCEVVAIGFPSYYQDLGPCSIL